MEEDRRAKQSQGKILLMEDDEDIATLIREVISVEIDCYLYWAARGEDARDAISEHNFDLVITDMMVRDFNGFQLIEEAKKMNPQLPIIVITGAYPNGFDQYAKALGIIAYFEKPFSLTQLASKVRESLTSRFNHSKETITSAS